MRYNICKMFFEELTPRQDGYRVVRILPEHFDCLCSAIRSGLLEICYGRDLVYQDPEFLTYKHACQEIDNMLNNMPDTSKMGCLGELIMHLVVPRVFGSTINPLSRLLSMSGRNIKHGFDLNYYEDKTHAIWYGEVKSGNNQKRRALMERARNGLKEYFLGINKSGSASTKKKWEVALNEINALYSEHDKKRRELVSFLRKSRLDISNGVSRNALIMVVNFGECDSDFESVDDIEKELTKIESECTFDKCLIISARRELFADILEFIANEGKMP